MTNSHGRGRLWSSFVTCVGVAVCGGIWMVSAWDDVDGDGVSVHREEKSPAEIRKYWTPERIREAEPAEMPVVRR